MTATISINDNACWICGTSDDLTRHHTLPRHLNPNRNIVVPVCQGCHNRINANDVAGLYAFASRIERSAQKLTQKAQTLQTLIENNTLIKNNAMHSKTQT